MANTGLNIRPSTSRERKLLFLETLLNTTDKVSKISENSVLSGVAGGVSKVAGKAEKDIIIAVSRLFPDVAYGSELDQCALDYGIAPRFTAQGSSTYLRLMADPGALYQAGIHYFRSSTGIEFELEEDILIPAVGFGYAKVRSTVAGARTNVDPLSISKVIPVPSGHTAVVNEVAATGGMDIESDELFRIRIKEGANILAKGTISMLEQAFMKINPKVLKVWYHGCDWNGKLRLAVTTQNGTNLSNTELNELLFKAGNFFTLSEYRPFGTEFYGIELSNMQFQPVDVLFRVDLDPAFNPDITRKAIQVGMLKYLDPRFFNPSTDKVEWETLLNIAQTTKGVRYIPDQYFAPREDIAVYVHKLPRLRSFVMLDLDGNIISNFSGSLLPTFYPNSPDYSYQQTVLSGIV